MRCCQYPAVSPDGGVVAPRNGRPGEGCWRGEAGAIRAAASDAATTHASICDRFVLGYLQRWGSTRHVQRSMYSTCIFCNHSLGANKRIERFPVGGRLAFDGAKGRLWAVCTECHRWNLSPLEERWEAIEECERLFRGTLVRVSTDNIGMARLTDGLELIRIGKPLRPEFAAWR